MGTGVAEGAGGAADRGLGAERAGRADFAARGAAVRGIDAAAGMLGTASARTMSSCGIFLCKAWMPASVTWVRQMYTRRSFFSDARCPSPLSVA